MFDTLGGGEYISDHANTAAWSDPKEDYVKINCDGSVVDFGIKAYCGGVCATNELCLVSLWLLTLIPSLWFYQVKLNFHYKVVSIFSQDYEILPVITIKWSLNLNILWIPGHFYNKKL